MADGPDARADPAPPNQARQAFVRRWTREVISTSYVPKSRPEIEAFLDERTGELIESLRAERFSTAAAAEVGARLVEAHFTGAAALDRSLQLFANELPELAAADRAPDDLLARTVELLGAFAAAFSEGLRERTLTEQEVIKQSVLRAKDVAEEARRASVARFRAVFTSSAIGIAIADLQGRLLETNRALTEITGRTDAQLREWTVHSFAERMGAEDLRVNQADLANGDLDRFHVECEFVNGEESVITELAVSLVRDAAGEPDYQVVLVQDVTGRHMLQQEMHRQAMHDPLTGLANRTLLKSRMEKALQPNCPGRRVGLCYFDLDGFKAINDSLGHPIGDDLLRAVAQRLQSLARSEGMLAARMGGDEFVVLAPDSPGTTALIEQVQRMLGAITEPVRLGGHELNASATVGVVEREVAGVSADDLLRDADITLYRAKGQGKAQWALFDARANEADRRRFQLSATMPAALEEYQFFVEYRPVIHLDAAQRELVAVRASIRWDHPTFGELESAEFLELAEETGLIARLGNWMLEQVGEHAARWADRLGERAPDVVVALSQRHFRAPDFVGDVRRILDSTGLSPRKLVLAVPEGAVFDEQGDPVDTVEILADLGIRLGLIDFGSHYRQLGALRVLSENHWVDSVMLSGEYLASFAREEGPDPLDEHVVAGLVAAARLLGFHVVARELDSALQVERLNKMGVEAAEGDQLEGLASAMEVEQLIGSGKYPVSRRCRRRGS
jgi:diguanylate cyclase (GGDEF)-like protein/PAS domain S-box-containing protein